jgi:hypothetical protein
MNFAPRPLAALLFLLTLYPAAAAQESTMRGTFVINRQASDDVNRVIEAAVGRLSSVTRPTMRGHLRKTNVVYGRVVINYTQQMVSITFDQRRPLESPANGTPVKWTREDGEKFDLSTEWEGSNLAQTFKGEGKEQRTNTFSISADGRTLTLGVVVSSPKLPRPLTYKLVFTRAS